MGFVEAWVAGLLAAAGMALGAIGKHVWSRIRSNPAIIAKEALELSEALADAAKDRKLTASELQRISKEAAELASKLR